MTREELGKVKYHDLKKKFTSLGIGHAFKAGEKKDALIEIALKELEILNKVEKDGKTEEEIVEQIEIVKKEEAEAKAEEESKKEEEAKEDLDKKGLSLEQIKEQIDMINLQLCSCPLSHRNILLAKQKILSAKLAELES